jgi:hypothetical protein
VRFDALVERVQLKCRLFLLAVTLFLETMVTAMPWAEFFSIVLM